MEDIDTQVLIISGLFVTFIVIVVGIFFANSIFRSNDSDINDRQESSQNLYNEVENSMGDTNQQAAHNQTAADRTKPEINVDELQIDRLAGGKLVVDVLEATDDSEPKTVETGDFVEVNYIGSLTDGEVFDNSFDRGQTFQFRVGEGRVIQGWDKGVAGTKVGDRILLLIPSELGYGARGAGDSIPPGADLVFIVDVVGVN